MQKALDAFFIAIHSRYDIEKPVAKRYLRRKLNRLNTLQTEIDRLKQEARQRDDYLRRLAVEYVVMGKECEREGMRDAATRNYEKAITLCPDMKEAKLRIKKLKNK